MDILEQTLKEKGLVHPLDYRYLVKELIPYLSEEAFLNYKLRVEVAHANAMARMGLCSEQAAKEISEKANTKYVTLKEVTKKEQILKHDIRSMIEVLKEKLSDEAKPYVHLGLTSNDVVNSAQTLMIRDATLSIIIPDMITLERIFIKLAKEEKSTIQIGRTHGQHAEPTTFGKEMAVYVDRWGRRIENILHATLQLRGKASGAVGTLASFCVICDEPEKLENLIMEELGLEKALISTQIVQPELLVNYFCQIEIAFATLADFANNMRHLQRSEIAEVFESFEEKQIGSSTMPHKRSPISWENIISQYRAVMPHVITAFMNIESEHQRDLRDSASTRYLIAEVLGAFDYSVRRATKAIREMSIDRETMKRNVTQTKDFCMAEPVYIVLALAGHHDAYNYVRTLVMKATKEKKKLKDLLANDINFIRALKKLQPKKRKLILNPKKYIGRSEQLVTSVTDHWEAKLCEIESCLKRSFK